LLRPGLAGCDSRQPLCPRQVYHDGVVLSLRPGRVCCDDAQPLCPRQAHNLNGGVVLSLRPGRVGCNGAQPIFQRQTDLSVVAHWGFVQDGWTKSVCIL
jgi:hypothetical protein